MARKERPVSDYASVNWSKAIGMIIGLSIGVAIAVSIVIVLR